MIKNALVVMFDSLQFNYLSCYGNTWIKTPNFERFAREGVVFENCYIEGLPTIPCRRAMHTGRYTLPHGGWIPLSMEDTTIADLCWGRPIDTCMVFDSAPQRLPKFGYTRGFDKVWFMHGHEIDHDFYSTDTLYHYKPEDFHTKRTLDCKTDDDRSMLQVAIHETSCYLKERQYWHSENDQHVAVVMSKAIEYLEQVDRNKQFFLWVDSFDPHEPWDPASVYDPDMKCPYDPNYEGPDVFLPFAGEVNLYYSEAELNHVRMLYAEKVTHCDGQLGNMMDAVRRLGLEENTLFMIVSDHGEPMGNGEHGHGIMRKCRPWPYEELVHAPMMLRAPGVKAGQRIPAFVQSVDVAPTVCDWLGIGVHPDMQGKSLLPLVRGEVSKLRDFAIAGYYNFSWAIFTEEWSYIHWLNEAVNAVDVATAMYNMDEKGVIGAKAVQNEIHKQLLKDATTDGADQWTCTPQSTAALPESDELYNRKTDPFQLNNVIKQHPDVAKQLYKTLTDFIATV